MKQLIVLALVSALAACDQKSGTPASGGPASPGGGTPGMTAPAPAAAALPAGEHVYYFGADLSRTKIDFESKTEVTNIIGTTNRVSGNATIDFDQGKGTCKLTVPVETLNSGMPDRDRAMLGKAWLSAKEFPTIEFESTKAAFSPPTKWKIDGKFTLHGTTKDISIQADVKRISEAQAKAAGLAAGSWIKVKTSFPVTLADYNIKIDPTAIATVDKVWNVSIDLFATTTKPGDAPVVVRKDDDDEGPKVVRIKPVSEEGIDGVKYKFGKKRQLATISAVSETEVETITAQTSAVAGILGFDKEKGTGKVRFRVPADHLTTAIALRDEHMKSPMWLDTKANPDILFESTKVAKKAGNLWTVEGNFTLHGVTRPIAIEVKMREIPAEVIKSSHWGETPGLGFDTSFVVKLSDYGIKIPDLAKAKVKDEWAVTLSLVALLEE
jgi:polyisoprenoid-binding protein YceI